MRKIYILALFIVLVVLGFLTWDNRISGYMDMTGPWSVGIGKVGALEDLQEAIGDYILDSVNSKSPVNADFVADPFFIKDSVGYHLFVEHAFKDHGDITYFFTQDLEQPFIYRDLVLDEKFHLSYPQVFAYQAKYYMLPETQGAGEVLLYKADSFPTKWSRDTVLIDETMQDPTLLIRAEDEFYIFGSYDAKLHCWKAKDLRGPYELVAKNLLVGSESRAAGRIFQWEGEWYLPVQNSSRGYGTGLSLYQISLEPSIKLEKAYPFFLGPRKDIEEFSHGMHHLDVQFIEGKYVVAYDGNMAFGDPVFNWKFFLKYNLLNLWNEWNMLVN
ncbi:hypothetical protein LZF95_11310 [Algoriphagus sp. AGSA1]|uniref:glucosamine inositolphosphorylceramide transferase family protein n=1 Tax=Algoriphagus sp. AGSA1 TaxID=2907213 RepID=UPI001F4568DE|nr:hypothetical protein [Algoriphagus sp. AGSA1]MCE7055264.1 hypothetical protein [Algoriphagus sp. AGSA1]